MLNHIQEHERMHSLVLILTSDNSLNSETARNFKLGEHRHEHQNVILNLKVSYNEWTLALESQSYPLLKFYRNHKLKIKYGKCS